MKAGLALLTFLLLPAWTNAAWTNAAWANSVTVVNGGTDSIRQIIIGTTPGSGDNRLRSTLPPGAQARITYSTGCQATVRLVFESGRSEDFADIDPCTDPRITAGAGTAAGQVAVPATASATVSATAPKITATSTKTLKPGATPASLPVKAPPPVVPPWTGKSITKRFGGME